MLLARFLRLRRPRRRHWLISLPALVVVGAAVALALFEGDLPDSVADATAVARHLARHYGPAGSLAGLYMEESGVPLPVAGDVLVLYLGHRFAADWAALVLVWLGLVATVTLGASNLYYVSRRWGRRLLEGPVGPALHLTPERMATVERWFARWGALAVIFGRHIFGFRIPVTVAAGLFGLPYRVFAPSVAVSAAPWAAVWLYLGVRFGDRLARFIDLHRWTYALVPIAILAFLGLALYRARRERRRRRKAVEPD